MTARAWSALRGVLLASTTDPRAIQAGFALLVAVDIGLRQVAGTGAGVSLPSLSVVLVLALLALTIVVRGRMPVAAVAAVLVADIAAVGLGARPAYAAAGIDLEVDAPGPLSMLLDRQRIEQVVDNLLTNAAKYSPPGTTVRVRLAVQDGRAQLSVQDQGIGISAADRDRLFTRFFRAREAEERSIQGVGLGLSIAREIVEAHGGRIEVDSEPGVGSTFRVRLPIEAPSRRRALTAQPQDGQVPKISRVWLTSEKPCSAAIAVVHRSAAGPSTSTVAPHARHTRWWWWLSEHRR